MLTVLLLKLPQWSLGWMEIILQQSPQEGLWIQWSMSSSIFKSWFSIAIITEEELGWIANPWPVLFLDFLEIAILLPWFACCSSKVWCQPHLSFKFSSLLKYVSVDHSRSIFLGTVVRPSKGRFKFPLFPESVPGL